MTHPGAHLADLFQELRELGLGGALYRAGREARLRVGVEPFLDARGPSAEASIGAARYHDDALMGAWSARPLFAAPGELPELRARIGSPALEALGERARQATRGKIRCFGRWVADFGNPIDWHRNPVTGRRWDPACHWSTALRRQGEVGDVKLTWEVGRFPHAYELARAAALEVAPKEALADALDQQIRSFVSNNPYLTGIHWNSGQEIAFRLMALTFSVGVLARAGVGLGALPAFVARGAFAQAQQLEGQLEFARRSVYNNHLLSEAVGLLLASWILPRCNATARWARLGLGVLEEQAERQVYRDGAYIQLSHTYHRVAMQDFLWALALRREQGEPVPPSLGRAMERSLDFLVAHENPGDGKLPNYGANDGALPCLLSTCDFTDFRPILQALSVATRGERLFEAGPWDEEAVWLLGRAAVDEAPVRPPSRRSVAFRDTGFYVLRGRDPRSFSAFRCGTIKDRFSQIDMLHLDVWWRGQNVLVDAGSYLYNGAEEWHGHFLGTASHNTVQVDGRDQMLHFRQFKCLYWTVARLLAFEDHDGWALCAGEHDGYRRHPGDCVHRRSVLFVKDDLWIVVDRVSGLGPHDLRLHWLCGELEAEYAREEGRVTLRTPEGPFTVTVLDDAGAPARGSLVSGQEAPPRGWLARYYAERVPVPSLAVERSGPLPLTLTTVLAAGVPEVTVRDGRWSVRAGGSACEFWIDDGLIVPLERPS